MATISKANIFSKVETPPGLALGLMGNEFELEWRQTTVAAGARIFIEVTSPPDRFTVVGYRELKFDQTRGFYRIYTPGNYTVGVLGAALPVNNRRVGSGIASGTTAFIATGVTADPANALTEIPLFGAESTGNRPGAGDLTGESSVRVIPPSTPLLLEFENSSPEACYWRSFFLQWEISPGAMPEATQV